MIATTGNVAHNVSWTDVELGIAVAPESNQGDWHAARFRLPRPNWRGAPKWAKGKMGPVQVKIGVDGIFKVSKIIYDYSKACQKLKDPPVKVGDRMKVDENGYIWPIDRCQCFETLPNGGWKYERKTGIVVMDCKPPPCRYSNEGHLRL